MRAIPNIGQPNPNAGLEERVRWLENIVQELLVVSQDDPATIADEYQVDGLVTPVRTLNVLTATTDDVKNVVATWLSDWRRRGTSRGTG